MSSAKKIQRKQFYFIDIECFRCYYILVRFCTGGVVVPLNELATDRRVAGINSVRAALKAGKALKIFLSKEADTSLLSELVGEAERAGVPVEWVEQSLQLGRACAVPRKTAAAAILKK